MRSCGGYERGGRIVIPAGFAIASGAEHLGEFDCCPIGKIKQNQEVFARVFEEYKGLKRFGIRKDDSIPLSYLIAIDEEVDKIRSQEIERERALEDAKRKGGKCRF